MNSPTVVQLAELMLFCRGDFSYRGLNGNYTYSKSRGSIAPATSPIATHKQQARRLASLRGLAHNSARVPVRPPLRPKETQLNG